MKYFKYEEFERSAKAQALKIDNKADEVISHNIYALVNNVLDPLRRQYGKPIYVSSGYRCKALNDAVGGSKTSQHMRGQAADIVPNDIKLRVPKEIKKLGIIIAHYLPFDQLIFEQCDEEHNPKWIHVSYSESFNRGEIKVNPRGTQKYIRIELEDI